MPVVPWQLVLALIFAAPFILLFAAELTIAAATVVIERTGVTLFLPAADRALVLSVPKFGLMMARSLRRNLLRTYLTYLATVVLVFVVTSVWSVLNFLDKVQSEKGKNLKAIVTEKFQIPSQMPASYIERIKGEILSLPPDIRPTAADMMTWAFVGATLDPANRTIENSLFFFALEPRSLLTMMDDLEPDRYSTQEWKEFSDAVGTMEVDTTGIILGKERMRLLNKRVGDKVKLFGLNYRGIDLEYTIVGEFPPGRYDQSAAMNRVYLDRALDDFQRKNGVPHPLAERCLNLFWVRLPTREAFEELAARVSVPGKFSSPSVKMETASSGISTFLDAYKDLVWGMRRLLSPAILVTMSLVIANAISIGVRERRTEMAVLKVLGFSPTQILTLILGEAVLIGTVSGALSSAFAFYIINVLVGGLKFPIAFFPAFFVPDDALWWGPLIGGGTALAGSILPAWSARSVKAAEVFSRVG